MPEAIATTDEYEQLPPSFAVLHARANSAIIRTDVGRCGVNRFAARSRLEAIAAFVYQMDGQQLADFIASRNLELAALLAFIGSRPNLAVLFDDSDIIIRIRKETIQPRIRIESEITARPKAESLSEA